MVKKGKMNILAYKIIAIMFAIVSVISLISINNVYAEGEEGDTTSSHNITEEIQNQYSEQLEDGKIDEIISDAGLKPVEITGDKAYNGDYYVSGGEYYKAGEVTSAITNHNIGQINGHVTANVGDANELVSGFEPAINLIIGVLAWLIVILLPLVTALDVCYITIPFVREKGEDAKASGNAMMTKTGKDGQTKLRWISDEAQYAVSDIDLENGGSPLKKYLTKRIGAFVMVAIILYLLIGGQITVVTQLAVRLVSGIMTIISSLGK